MNGLPERVLSEGALRKLANYAWPGNVRELENTIHRAVLLALEHDIEAAAIELTAEPIQTSSLLPGAAAAAPSIGAARMADGAAGVANLVGRTMDDVERALILSTLTHTMGNRTHAATILGISIRALRNKLRDYTAQGLAVPPPAAGVAA